MVGRSVVRALQRRGVAEASGGGGSVGATASVDHLGNLTGNSETIACAIAHG